MMNLKGYYTASGYQGHTPDGYMLFETEEAYYEYMEETNNG